jgi:2-iminobutanoate/2-iminopropanoate deaminase
MVDEDDRVGSADPPLDRLPRTIAVYQPPRLRKQRFMSSREFRLRRENPIWLPLDFVDGVIRQGMSGAERLAHCRLSTASIAYHHHARHFSRISQNRAARKSSTFYFSPNYRLRYKSGRSRVMGLAVVDGVNPPNVWHPFGAFSMAVIQGEGQIVHLKGQVSLDPAGQVVGVGDMRVQVRQVLENIRDVLASMGGQMADIVSLVHYATNIAKFMDAGDIRKEFFAAPLPVTTTVQIARLFHPELMIEIAAIAEIPRDRFHRPQT